MEIKLKFILTRLSSTYDRKNFVQTGKRAEAEKALVLQINETF